MWDQCWELIRAEYLNLIYQIIFKFKYLKMHKTTSPILLHTENVPPTEKINQIDFIFCKIYNDFKYLSRKLKW